MRSWSACPASAREWPPAGYNNNIIIIIINNNNYYNNNNNYNNYNKWGEAVVQLLRERHHGLEPEAGCF
jgi:hypothetical protein